jgi:hypothetical protein
MKYLLSFTSILFLVSIGAVLPGGVKADEALLLATRTPAQTEAPTEEAEATEEPEEATAEITADEGPLAFLGYQVNEARFNPSPENPAALNIMASMDFQNTSDERLEVRSPRFTMTINGVEWPDLASTDFQIGRLQAGASQAIELQSLLLLRRATPEQQEVIDDILAGEPVTLEITGTILVFPGGEETSLNATFLLEDITLPNDWARPTTDRE